MEVLPDYAFDHYLRLSPIKLPSRNSTPRTPDRIPPALSASNFSLQEDDGYSVNAITFGTAAIVGCHWGEPDSVQMIVRTPRRHGDVEAPHSFAGHRRGAVHPVHHVRFGRRVRHRSPAGRRH